MNLLLIVVAIVLIGNVAGGYKRGMVRQLISFVSLIVMCIIAALIANGMKNYVDGNVLNVILAVFLLCILGIAHHLLGIVFFSAKVISKLPIVHWLDKLAGIVFGVLETILLLWMVYTFHMMMNLGMVGEQIMEYTRSSRILTWLYQHNYLAYLVENFTADFIFSQALEKIWK